MTDEGGKPRPLLSPVEDPEEKNGAHGTATEEAADSEDEFLRCIQSEQTCFH